MGAARQMWDGLVNALSGLGTTTDPRSYNRYFSRRLTDPEIDVAFRSSWLMRKIIAKPAAEMVREWRDWQADNPTIEKLEAEEKRLQLQAKTERALILAGLGGAGMVIYTGDADQAQPLDPKSIGTGGIKALHVWHRSSFTLGPMIDQWDDPYFGQPSYYEMRLGGQQAVRFHPSRIVAFRGQPTAGIVGGSWQDAWWGDSTVQVVKDAVDNVETAEGGFAALIGQARLRRLSIPKLLELVSSPGGEAKLQKRVQALAITESSLSVTVLDGGDGEKGAEKIEDRQMVWTGIPDIKASYLAVAAAAANMPATVLLGKSPDGMNATGAGDLTIWEQEVKSRQDLRLRPCLDQLDAVLIPSALGTPQPGLWWRFAPLSTPTEAVEAKTFWDFNQGLSLLVATGLVPDIALSKGVQNWLSERAYLPGIDDALSELPEDERFPQPEPDETDPSALQEGGDPTSTGAGGPMEPAPRRRAANDALVAAGVDAPTIARVLDAAFGPQA